MASLRHSAVLARLAIVLLAWGLGAGCSSSDPAIAAARSVCPSCPVQVGGETSDFGGTPSPCGAISGGLEIDEAEAIALGFDLGDIRQRIERPIDAAMRWSAQETDAGEPATGFEESTRILGNVAITSYEHWRPDPQYCDGTTCNSEERGVADLDQASCAHFLTIKVRVELRTLDGAIDAVADGEAVQWSEGFEDIMGEDSANQLFGHVYANLHQASGSLGLFPDEGELQPAQYRETHYPGVLVVVLDFSGDQTRGEMWPEIWFAVVDDVLEVYQPLKGTWPSES